MRANQMVHLSSYPANFSSEKVKRNKFFCKESTSNLSMSRIHLLVATTVLKLTTLWYNAVALKESIFAARSSKRNVLMLETCACRVCIR